MCAPFAIGANHEAWQTARAAGVEALAPESLWRHCALAGKTSAEGVLLADVGQALADVGQPPLGVWPYNPHLGPGTEEPPTAAGPEPWRIARFEELAVAHDGIEADLEDQLAGGSPVVLVVELTDEFDNPGPDGHVAIPDLRAPPGDYHAVLVVGAATHPAHGRCLLVRNSWGEGWAAGGYAWLPIDYLRSFAVQAGVVGPATGPTP